MYHSALGTFLQRDPAGYFGEHEPTEPLDALAYGGSLAPANGRADLPTPPEAHLDLAMNLYEFLRTNPLVNLDPSGLAPIPIDIGILQPSSPEFYNFLKTNGFTTIDLQNGLFVQTKTGCPLFCRNGTASVTISVSANCAKSIQAGKYARGAQAAINSFLNLFPPCSSVPAGASTIPSGVPAQNATAQFNPEPIGAQDFPTSFFTKIHCEFYMSLDAQNYEPMLKVVPPGGFIGPLPPNWTD